MGEDQSLLDVDVKDALAGTWGRIRGLDRSLVKWDESSWIRSLVKWMTLDQGESQNPRLEQFFFLKRPFREKQTTDLEGRKYTPRLECCIVNEKDFLEASLSLALTLHFWPSL